MFVKDLAGFDQDSWKLIVGVRAVPQGINAVSDLTVGTINSVPDSVDAITDFGIQSGNKWISKLPSRSGEDPFYLLANFFLLFSSTLLSTVKHSPSLFSVCLITLGQVRLG